MKPTTVPYIPWRKPWMKVLSNEISREFRAGEIVRIQRTRAIDWIRRGYARLATDQENWEMREARRQQRLEAECSV